MATFGSMKTYTSPRALDANGDVRSEPAQQTFVSDFTKLEAVESRSILGRHDGTLPDDLLDLVEASAT